MRRVAFASLFMLACASDRSVPTVRTSVLDALRASSAFGAVFSSRATLVRTEHGFHVRAASGVFRPAGPRLEVTLPAVGGDPLHLGVEGDPDLWIELTPRGARPAVSDPSGAILVQRDVEDATDVVLVADGVRVEEIRVLLGPRAPSRARYRIAHGTHVSSVRVEDRRVEVRDTEGRLRIVSEPPFAVDHHDVRRDVLVRIDRGDLETTVDLADLSFPVFVDPAWTAVSAMSTPRSQAVATVLADGKVLVTGGNAGGALSTAEVFDPVTETWSSVSSMSISRAGHTATLLGSGKVLVTGAGTTCEVFDPSNGTFAPAAPLPAIVISGATATRLADDSVLLAGGSYVGAMSTAYRYLPATNAWETVGALTAARTGHAALLLESGKVLVSGSSASGGNLSSAELYDPIGKTWTATGSMKAARAGHQLVRVSGGRALAGGGYAGAAETYEPTAGYWQAFTLPSSGMPVSLTNGHVLLAATSQSRVLDSSGGTLRDAPGMGSAHELGMFVPLPNERALVVGGMQPPIVVSTAEVFAQKDYGAACADSGECRFGNCMQGVCCNRDCSGQCEWCALPGKLGTCWQLDGEPPRNGTSCTAPAKLCSKGACATLCAKDVDCLSGAFCNGGACADKVGLGFSCALAAACFSGFCADGVCCDGACGGQCQACDTEAAHGKCTAITGKPHAGRPACSTDPTSPCAARACDGVVGIACVGFAANDVTCRMPTCADGVLTEGATCNGKGLCPAIVSTQCPYFFACAADGTTCATSCADDAGCVKGYTCQAARCVEIPSSLCRDDVTSRARDGTERRCEPYRCGAAGACVTACVSQSDCAPAYTCTSQGRCEAPAVVDGSDCGLARSRQVAQGPVVALLLAALYVARRRRRQTRPSSRLARLRHGEGLSRSVR